MLSTIIGFIGGLAAALTVLLREGKAYALAGTLGVIAFVLLTLGRFGFWARPMAVLAVRP